MKNFYTMKGTGMEYYKKKVLKKDQIWFVIVPKVYKVKRLKSIYFYNKEKRNFEKFQNLLMVCNYAWIPEINI